MNYRTTCVKLLFVVSACVGFSGCTIVRNSPTVDWAALYAGTAPTQEAAESSAKAAILEGLKDPDSAKFRSVTPLFKTFYQYGPGQWQRTEPLWAICVEVNAKNAFGGYVGYQYWLVKFRNEQPVLDQYGFLPGGLDCQTGPADPTRRAY